MNNTDIISSKITNNTFTFAWAESVQNSENLNVEDTKRFKILFKEAELTDSCWLVNLFLKCRSIFYFFNQKGAEARVRDMLREYVDSRNQLYTQVKRELVAEYTGEGASFSKAKVEKCVADVKQSLDSKPIIVSSADIKAAAVVRLKERVALSEKVPFTNWLQDQKLPRDQILSNPDAWARAQFAHSQIKATQKALKALYLGVYPGQEKDAKEWAHGVARTAVSQWTVDREFKAKTLESASAQLKIAAYRETLRPVLEGLSKCLLDNEQIQFFTIFEGWIEQAVKTGQGPEWVQAQAFHAVEGIQTGRLEKARQKVDEYNREARNFVLWVYTLSPSQPLNRMPSPFPQVSVDEIKKKFKKFPIEAELQYIDTYLKQQKQKVDWDKAPSVQPLVERALKFLQTVYIETIHTKMREEKDSWFVSEDKLAKLSKELADNMIKLGEQEDIIKGVRLNSLTLLELEFQALKEAVFKLHEFKEQLRPLETSQPASSAPPPVKPAVTLPNYVLQPHRAGFLFETPEQQKTIAEKLAGLEGDKKKQEQLKRELSLFLQKYAQATKTDVKDQKIVNQPLNRHAERAFGELKTLMGIAKEMPAMEDFKKIRFDRPQTQFVAVLLKAFLDPAHFIDELLDVHEPAEQANILYQIQDLLSFLDNPGISKGLSIVNGAGYLMPQVAVEFCVRELVLSRICMPPFAEDEKPLLAKRKELETYQAQGYYVENELHELNVAIHAIQNETPEEKEVRRVKHEAGTIALDLLKKVIENHKIVPILNFVSQIKTFLETLQTHLYKDTKGRVEIKKQYDQLQKIGAALLEGMMKEMESNPLEKSLLSTWKKSWPQALEADSTQKLWDLLGAPLAREVVGLAV